MDENFNYNFINEGLIFQVSVIPNSSQSKIVGLSDGIIKLKLNSPPIEGKANKEVILFLSKLLHVPKTSIKILKGDKSKLKTILISADKELLQEKIKLLNL